MLRLLELAKDTGTREGSWSVWGVDLILHEICERESKGARPKESVKVGLGRNLGRRAMTEGK